jgi:hypothetical protein
MADIDEAAIRKAMAPGIAQAQRTFADVAERMSDRSADEVHHELVERLQAEPFAWDDQELQKLATSIGQAPGGDEPKGEPEGETKDEASDQSA